MCVYVCVCVCVLCVCMCERERERWRESKRGLPPHLRILDHFNLWPPKQMPFLHWNFSALPAFKLVKKINSSQKKCFAIMGGKSKPLNDFSLWCWIVAFDSPFPAVASTLDDHNFCCDDCILTVWSDICSCHHVYVTSLCHLMSLCQKFVLSIHGHLNGTVARIRS